MRTASGDYGLLAPDEDHAEAHQPGPQPHPHAHAHARARDPDRDAADQPAGPGYGGGGGGFGSFADRGHSGSGDFGAAWNSARSAKGQTQLQDTFLEMKMRGLGLASYIKDKTTEARESLKKVDWNPDKLRDNTFSSLKTWSTGAAERVTNATHQGWQQAQEGLKRFSGGPLAGICKHEAATRPCARTVLVCCTALVTNGLSTQGILKESAPNDLTHFLLCRFEDGVGAVLPPPGTSPHVIANTLKQFLITLPEPLLTFKLLPDIIEAGLQHPVSALTLVMQLPPSNFFTLQVVLEAANRIAGNAAENGMDARALATALAPCLAWHPAAARDQKGYSQVGAYDPFQYGGEGSAAPSGTDSPTANGAERHDLAGAELRGIVNVLEYLVANLRSISEGSSHDYVMATASSNLL